jgi:hypothetical protein
MSNKLHSARFILPVILVILAFGIVACSQGASLNQQIKITDDNMTVQKFGTSPSSIAVISGSAQNTGSTTVVKATITAKFLDDQGNTVATGSASIDNLSPGLLWNFTIQTTGPDAWKIVKYELTIN